MELVRVVFINMLPIEINLLMKVIPAALVLVTMMLLDGPVAVESTPAAEFTRK